MLRILLLALLLASPLHAAFLTGGRWQLCGMKDSHAATASGLVFLNDDNAGNPELVVSLNFDQCNLAGVNIETEIPWGSAIHFFLKSDDRLPKGSVRFQDASEQTHERRFSYRCDGKRDGELGQWEKYEIPLADKKSQSYWGGAEDGLIHWPIKNLQVFVWRTVEPTADFSLRDISWK